MKMLSPFLISYRATAMRPLRKSKIILYITHWNTSNNFRHSLIKRNSLFLYLDLRRSVTELFKGIENAGFCSYRF